MHDPRTPIVPWQIKVLKLCKLGSRNCWPSFVPVSPALSPRARGMIVLWCLSHVLNMQHPSNDINTVRRTSWPNIRQLLRAFVYRDHTGAAQRPAARGSRAVQRRTNGNARAGAPGDRAGTSEAVLVWAWHAQRSDGRERQRLETRRHCVRGRQSGCFPDRAP